MWEADAPDSAVWGCGSPTVPLAQIRCGAARECDWNRGQDLLMASLQGWDVPAGCLCPSTHGN